MFTSVNKTFKNTKLCWWRHGHSDVRYLLVLILCNLYTEDISVTGCWHEMKSDFLKLFSRKASKKAQGERLSVFKIHIYMTPGLVQCRNGCTESWLGTLFFSETYRCYTCFLMQHIFSLVKWSITYPSHLDCASSNDFPISPWIANYKR